MIIRHGGRKINISARKLSFFGKITGLMFKSRKTDNLLFTFNKNVRMRIHSYFVFFSFLALWLDGENNVIEFKTVNPFRLSIYPKKPFMKLIEIPFNDKNKKIIGFFVDEGKI